MQNSIFSQILNQIVKNKLNVPKTFYLPPYNSPIEDSFAYWLSKYINDETLLLAQYFVQTKYKHFKIDFILQRGDQIIGIECDGKKYHTLIEDTIRDTLILETKKVNALIRLRGKDIFNEIHDCLLIISFLFPQFFSKRGIINIEQLASRSISTQHLDFMKPFLEFNFENELNYDGGIKNKNIRIVVKRYKSSDYYYYDFPTLVDIMHEIQLDSFENLCNFFKDLPRRVDEYLDQKKISK